MTEESIEEIRKRIREQEEEIERIEQEAVEILRGERSPEQNE